jgi:hypothetical protein
MTSTGLAPRARSAYAIKAAAKQRRQRNLAIAGFVVLIVVMAWEIPKLLNRGSSPQTAPATVVPVVPTAPRVALPKALRSGGSDPFAPQTLVGGDPDVGPAVPGHDPFAAPTDVAPTSTPVTAQPLPEQIVIGTPTKGGKTTRGWIVILASIPTAQGRSSALAFARDARRNGIGSVSVLNSSNRRPLRGGYWVVYAGPYPTLSDVSQRASAVHASGYRTAYIRELIVYS